MKTKIQEKFKAMFGDGASLFASPGRVNLIGEHTDYNLGFVLPGAIDKAIYVALKPNNGTVCRVYSLDYDETVELDLHGEKPSQQQCERVGCTSRYSEKFSLPPAKRGGRKSYRAR